MPKLISNPDHTNTIGKGNRSVVVPYSSSDEDIYHGLLQDLQLQSSQPLSSDERATAQANYLNWILTQNQRQFDTQWRDNEREYTSATSQLERLMATGMSYSAALAALNGSGEVGSNSGIPQMAALKADPNSDVNTALNGVNTAVSSLSSFMTLGLSAAQLGLQAPLLKGQSEGQVIANKVANMQANGIDLANNFLGMINCARNFSPITDVTDPVSGQVSKRHEFDPNNFSSVDDLIQGFSSYSHPNYPRAAQYLSNGGLEQLESNIFARQYLEQMLLSRNNASLDTAAMQFKRSQGQYASYVASSLVDDITQEQLNQLWQLTISNQPSTIKNLAESDAYAYLSNYDVINHHIPGTDISTDYMTGVSPHNLDDNPLTVASMSEIMAYLIDASNKPYQSELQNDYINEMLKNCVSNEHLRSCLIALDSAFYGSVKPSDISPTMSKIKILWDKYGLHQALSSALQLVPVVQKFVPQTENSVSTSTSSTYDASGNLTKRVVTEK